MKTCAASRSHFECTECSDRAACPHSEVLEEMRTGARGAGLFVETEDADSLGPLAEWILKLHAQWPSCILFLDDQDSGP